MPADWDPEGEVAYISVQAFTPILGTLLLSPNTMVGGPARFAVVDVLSRIRKLDEQEDEKAQGKEVEEDIYVGTFARAERKMLREELLQQVVIGMGRLDISEEGEMVDTGNYDGYDAAAMIEEQHIADIAAIPLASPPQQDIVNPYFPVLSSPWTESVASNASLSPGGSTPLHVSFAELPPAPSPGASYRPEEQGSFSPDWVPPTPQLSHATVTMLDPPIAMQDRHPHEDAEMHAEPETEEGEAEEQAAVGRLSSMSLIAAVAASGPMEEHTQTAFVAEVERIGKDQVYWVRREASFALGALAKVVPQEVVLCALLPVFDALRCDTVWHVRHSALFALPAILARLSPKQRRSLALDTIVPLSVDESAPVRLGVLEALGEVLYTFHEDAEGPPEELLRLFLGRAEDRRRREEQHVTPVPMVVEQFAKHQVWGTQRSPFRASPVHEEEAEEEESPLESFYRDPARPLICAFNYPAVALTLGRARWGELTELYASLAKDPATKVRRTLAASLGELAKIIGPESAQRDLLPVWWSSIQCEVDGETRLKAIECLEVFVGVLEKGKGKEEVAQGLLDTWRAGTLAGWRERKSGAGVFVGLARAVGHAQHGVIKGLLMLALEDGVAGVREAAVGIVSALVEMRHKC